MKSIWNLVTVAEIAAPSRNAIAMGPFGSRIKTENFVDHGVPVIRGVNLNANRFRDENFVYLTEEKADELKASNAFYGDLVFTHRGTIGQVAIIPYNATYPRYVVSQSQMKFSIDKSKADQYFIFYFFRSSVGQYELLKNTSSTGVPAIAQPSTSLKKIEIPLPPLPNQRRIAAILGALDDKIELNRRMNQTLEEMAQAIFKSWFIDFDGHTDLVDSELGPIPRGWEFTTIGNIIELAYGKSLAKKVRIEGPYPVYGSGGINGYHFKAIVEGPGIIIGRKGTVGSVYWEDRNFYPIDTTFYVKLKDENVSLHWILYNLINMDIQRLGADSAVPGVNRNTIYAQVWCLPPKSRIQKFENIVSPLMRKLYANREESKILAELRDTLLPKLISDELDVSDIDIELPDHVEEQNAHELNTHSVCAAQRLWALFVHKTHLSHLSKWRRYCVIVKI